MTTRFICEIGSNHNQDLKRTLKLIDEAAFIGAWAVKFQLFKAEKLYAAGFTNQIEKMKKWELPIEFLPEIKNQCIKKNVKFICTPFYLEAIDILTHYVDYFKIGSYENEWLQLLCYVAETGKPWMISNGINDNPIINDKYKNKLHDFCNIFPAVIFHCNSNYPADARNCNLWQIPKMKRLLSKPIKVGWSDHTVSPAVIYRAIALGAEYIEFHFDLDDTNGFESSIGHCWQARQIRKVIANVFDGDLAEQKNTTNDSEAKKWKTDSADGLRPLIEYRGELLDGLKMEK